MTEKTKKLALEKKKSITKKRKKRQYVVSEMVEIIEAYTKKTDMPIIKEVCIQNDWIYRCVRQLAADERHKDLKDCLEALVAKKEVFLEKGLVMGKLKPAGAIFSLKQLGWREDYMNSDQLEKITLENVMNKKNIEILEEKLKLMRGDTDLTQIKEFLIEVKKVVQDHDEPNKN